eukprot:39614-Eustigmatos_ZCMA.PRE.1
MRPGCFRALGSQAGSVIPEWGCVDGYDRWQARSSSQVDVRHERMGIMNSVAALAWASFGLLYGIVSMIGCIDP